MKILYFIRALNVGGAETFIYNTLRTIDEKEFQIDFVLQSLENTNVRLVELCKKKKRALHVITPFYKNYLKSVKELKNILKIGNYDLIHIHANALLNMVPVIAAKSVGVKIALHSHNTKNNLGGFIGYCLHKFNRCFVNKLDVIRLACGEEAGKWMYGNKPFVVLNNAIDIDAFKFNMEARNEIRQQLGIVDEFAIGHVSRFVDAKNHNFLIDIFNEILKVNMNCKLILVGDGERLQSIKNKCKDLGMKEKVIFVGSVQDSSKYYSAFDCMIFPSFFEGMPFTLVEAQAAGLPIFASSRITKKINITGTLHYIGLEKGAYFWAREVLWKENDIDRGLIYKRLKGSVFDEKAEIDKLQLLYLRSSNQ